VAAAVLLLEEAGGVATGFEGEPVNLGPGITNIVASNAQIHADLLDIVNLRRA
jgi:fructose-1,6-bisphosphatase/inositol monophosphatase family enzyme